MWCVDHTEGAPCKCKPSNWQLLYRYTVEEMDQMIDRVEKRGECLVQWIEKAKAILNTDNGHIAGWLLVSFLGGDVY